MKRRSQIILAALFFGVTASVVSRADPALVPLTDQDHSRSELLHAEMLLEEPGSKGLGQPFYFPDDVKKEWVYGIDISHHNYDKKTGKIALPWTDLPKLGVNFIYIKASEGEGNSGDGGIDSRFEESWHSASAISSGKVYIGAYHFLTADGDPKIQAQTFVYMIKNHSNFKVGTNLPPSLDLEWDCVHKKRSCPDPKNPDKWAKYTPEQIQSKVEVFAEVIQSELGVTPIVYSQPNWWAERGMLKLPKSDAQRLWIADYKRRSLKDQKPRVPKNRDWVMWQFTDNSRLDQKCIPTDKNSSCIDTSLVPTDLETFKKTFGLQMQN